MELQQMVYALTVYKTRNFTKAAEVLHITQPTLSQQIHRIEDELHIRLFVRKPHLFLVTPEGEEFIKLARPVVDNYEKLLDGMRKFEISNSGKLRLGIIPTIGKIDFSRSFNEYCEQYRDVEVRITEDYSSKIYKQLCNGLLDVAIFNSFPDFDTYDGKIDCYELSSDYISVVCNRQHPLASMSQIQIEDAMKYTMVLFPDESSIEQVLLHAIDSFPSSSTRIIKVTTVENMISFIENGSALSFLSHTVAKKSITAQMKEIPLCPKVPVKTFLGISKKFSSNHPASIFASFMLGK